MNEIILKAKGELIDKVARDLLQKIWTKIETLNDRTKQHTIEIRELREKIK